MGKPIGDKTSHDSAEGLASLKDPKGIQLGRKLRLAGQSDERSHALEEASGVAACF
jgi:hypothetical protein